MAMLFNRKTGASFLVALLAAGLPCTVFAGPQEQQAKVIQAMQQAPLVVKNPPVLGLKVDRADVYQLPRNFRMATDEYKGMTKSGIMPTRQGLEKLHASASSCFSEKELEAVLAAVPVSADNRTSFAAVPSSAYRGRNGTPARSKLFSVAPPRSFPSGGFGC